MEPDNFGVPSLAGQDSFAACFFAFDFRSTSVPDPSALNVMSNGAVFGCTPAASETRSKLMGRHPESVSTRDGRDVSSVVNEPSGFAYVVDDSVRSSVISTRWPWALAVS